MKNIHDKKAQSAMEYLMTYGWAILIIAVVLGALFSLGVFSGASVIGTACVASPGFICSYLTFSHSTGNIIVTVGQSTGTPWQAWAIAYAPSNIPSAGTGIPIVQFYPVTGIASLFSGQQTVATLNSLVNSPVSVGTATFGDIWVCYSTTSSATLTSTSPAGSCTFSAGTAQYSQIATFTAKAV